MRRDSDNSNIMWKIRNNVRKNNFKAVADIVKNVIYMEDTNPEKKQLMTKIYRDVIEPWVKGINVEQEVPRQYEEMFIDFARELDENTEQEKILDMLKRIENSRNPKIQKKVRRQINLMGLTQELLKEDEIDTDAVEKYTDELEEDTDSSTYAELISKLFGKEFPIEVLDIGQLEKTLGGKRRTHGNEESAIREAKEYPDELKVDKRLKFLINELNTEPIGRFAETGIFSGSILLDIKDSDIVVVERLFEIYADGTYDFANQQSGKASSTYILPKDKILEMVKEEAKSKVRKELEKETEDKGLGKWKPIRHTKNWMERVKDRVENAKEIEQVEKSTDNVHLIGGLDMNKETDVTKSENLEEVTNGLYGEEEKVHLTGGTEKVLETEELEEFTDVIYGDENSTKLTSEMEELTTEQLEKQLRILREQNKKKEQAYKQKLIAKIIKEQQRGKELDDLIANSKTVDY